MNIRDLTYLVALAEHRHFGKAAKACFVSQPALSMQIKKLEMYLDIQLVERTNSSVLLTQTGFLLVEKAKDILRKVKEMREIAKSAADPYSGELTIGIIPTLAPYLLPHITPTLSTQFPNLKLYLREEQTAKLITQLEQGKIDAAILAIPIAENDFVTHLLFEEDFLLAVPDNHKFAQKNFIHFKELYKESLLLLEEGHCLREQALAICQKTDARESINFKATSLETLRHMIANGVGTTLMPKLACHPTPGLTYLPFHSPSPSRKIAIISRSTSAKELVIHEIARHITR